MVNPGMLPILEVILLFIIIIVYYNLHKSMANSECCNGAAVHLGSHEVCVWGCD